MDDDLERAGRMVARRLFRASEGAVDPRVLRNRLRQIGDEIGEPVIPYEGEIPRCFLRVSVPNAGGSRLDVAMSPEALKKILGRV